MEPTPATGHSISINDIEMYYVVRGEGEPLILLHGGGGIGANWDLVFPSPPDGYKLIVPDLRGHGRTTNPPGRFSFKQIALDVFALLDHLRINRFKAIGMSLGAKTLVHVATQQPERVEAMVLVSGTPYFPTTARSIMATMTPETRTEAEWKQMRQWHTGGDEQIIAIWDQMRSLKDSYDDMNFTKPLLSTIVARTLIVHGDRDPLYPANLAMEMYEAIPDSFLWIIPNGGHGPIFGEFQGAGVTTVDFAKIALAFLRREW